MRLRIPDTGDPVNTGAALAALHARKAVECRRQYEEALKRGDDALAAAQAARRRYHADQCRDYHRAVEDLT